MDLFEYQGKQYFARYDIPVSPGGEADTVDAAVAVAEKIGYPVVVKAQVKVGGRGKAGGIKLANDADEVRLHAGNILGMDIKGHTVHRLWIELSSDIAAEYYVSFTLDRPNKVYLGMLSKEGGVDIEEVAETNPDAIKRIAINPVDGFTLEQARAWVAEADLDEAAREQAAELIVKLFTCYVEGDCDLAEINPLILTTDGIVRALDAKVTLDDNAEYRHPEWDVVNQVGGSAANFLDIGGGANADVMTAALEVINADPSVKSIFVNIFGGITRVDEVAKGVIEALRRVDIKSPIVLRLDGTNAVEGRALLAEHLNEKLVAEPTMLEAARRAVALAGN